MTDAGIDGKLYPFTYWLSEEDDRRLMRIMEVTGVTDESEIVAAALRTMEIELQTFGFSEGLIFIKEEG